MSSKKLLAILSRYLWPVDSGRKESLNHYFKELHDTYGYEIRIMCFLEFSQQYDSDDIPEYIEDVTVLKDIRFIHKLVNILNHSFFGEKWPFQCAMYYSGSNLKQIKEYIEQWEPDVIFTEMIRTCVYFAAFRDSKAVTIANLDDLLSKRYLRQAEFDNSRGNIAGTFSGKLPGITSKISSNTILRRRILKMEAKRCEKWECEYYRLFDYILMTSDIERDEINDKMSSDKALTLSVGVDSEYYRQECTAKKDMVGISYLGNLNVAANVDTLELIAQQILPRLNVDYHFYVIGNCPNQVRSKYSDNEKIRFCGRVDDIREFVKSTTVFLAPIAYGTGIKTKIIEAMAMGMPVVTNSVGAEGINAIKGKDLIISDQIDILAKETERLLLNPDEAERIGKNASAYANENYDWDKVLSVFKKMEL